MRMRTMFMRHLAGLLTLLVISLALVIPTQAASRSKDTKCVNHKHITNWKSAHHLAQKGFRFDIIGDQASVTFAKELSLDLASDVSNSEYTASRITEIEGTLPIAQRVKCWQATADKDVVVEFTVRFDQAVVQPGMTENLILWNAPLPSHSHPEPIQPISAVGVSRNNGMYSATVAQDLDLTTFNGLLRQQPMPEWLNAADWHSVKITLSQASARIEVAQGAHAYTTILEVTLPHPMEPLGFEFSVDNEAFPEFFVPVVQPDGLDVDFLDIQLVG